MELVAVMTQQAEGDRWVVLPQSVVVVEMVALESRALVLAQSPFGPFQLLRVDPNRMV